MVALSLQTLLLMGVAYLLGAIVACAARRALSEADAWLTELSTGPARERVARMLLRLIRGETASECTLFGREDLGAMLGITTETASRTIAEFKRKGLLTELGSNRFRVAADKLQALLSD